MKNDMDEVDEFFGLVPRTYYVGDCRRVASVTEATTEGYFLGAAME